MAGSRRKTRGYSIRITKILKIRAEFFALFDRCEAVHESADFKEKLRAAREFYEYMSKHRKVLRVSDEKVNCMEADLIALEKCDAEVARVEAKLAKAERKAERSRQEYYDSLLKEPPTGKKRVEH